MNRPRIAWGLGAVSHPVVAHDRHDSQPIVLENLLPTEALGLAVRLQLPPLADRFLVAPEGKRE